MPWIAGLLIVAGVWVVYAGYNGLNPISTIAEIIRNPGQAAQIIAGSKKPIPGGNGGSGVVAYARAQIGKPYKLGAAGPDAFDCSGLTKAAYATIGINLPHSALAQLNIGQRINKKADLRPGDLVFPSIGATALGDHVQIWTGSGTIIEAALPGTKVRERAPWGLGSGPNVRAVRPQ